MFLNHQHEKYFFYKYYGVELFLIIIGLLLSIIIMIKWAISHEDLYPLFFSIVLFGLSIRLLYDYRKTEPQDWNVVVFNEESIESKRVLKKEKTVISLKEPVYYLTFWQTMPYEQVKVVLISNSPIDVNMIKDDHTMIDLEQQIMIVSNTLENDFVALDKWINLGTVY